MDRCCRWHTISAGAFVAQGSNQRGQWRYELPQGRTNMQSAKGRLWPDPMRLRQWQPSASPADCGYEAAVGSIKRRFRSQRPGAAFALRTLIVTMTRHFQQKGHALQSSKSPAIGAVRPRLCSQNAQPHPDDWFNRSAINADGFLPATSVLVVEQAPESLEQVREALCGEAVYIQIAATEAAVAQMLASQCFDLVLIATNLRNMSPLKLVSWVRESARCRNAMVVLMSAGWNDAAARAKLPLHDLVFSKPLESGLLRACLGCLRPAPAAAETPAPLRRLALPAGSRKHRREEQVTGPASC